MPLNPQRTIDELKELRELTGDADGAQRVAWTDTWAKARAWFKDKLADLPVDYETDEAGNVWVTNSGNDTVVQLAPDCTLMAAFGLPGSQSAGMFKRPLALAVDSRGSIWVTNSRAASVTRINPDGTANQFFGGGLNAPWGLAVDGDDHVFIANSRARRARIAITPTNMMIRYAVVCRRSGFGGGLTMARYPG